MGRFVGDGWVNENDVVICGHIKEYKIVKKCINIIRDVFGVDGYGERIEPNNNRCSCYTYSKELTINFENWFGKRAHNKKVPDFIFHLEPEKIKSFLRGYYDADVYERKNTQQASTVSNFLSYQLILLENMLGNTSTIRHNEDAKCWSFEYSINDKINRPKLIKNDNGNVHYPISEIKIYKPKRNDEIVYDLEIEDDSSFVVGLSTVHNCHRIGQKDTVWIYPLIFRETIDEYVFSVIEDKRAEIMKGIDNIDYESNVSESVIWDVVNKIKKKYGN
jgi:intein/homing endonuclease